MGQGSTRKRYAVHKFGNCRCEIVGRRVSFIWSLIHGSSWSGLMKAEPDHQYHTRRRCRGLSCRLVQHQPKYIHVVFQVSWLFIILNMLSLSTWQASSRKMSLHFRCSQCTGIRWSSTHPAIVRLHDIRGRFPIHVRLVRQTGHVWCRRFLTTSGEWHLGGDRGWNYLNC